MIVSVGWIQEQSVGDCGTLVLPSLSVVVILTLYTHWEVALYAVRVNFAR